MGLQKIGAEPQGATWACLPTSPSGPQAPFLQALLTLGAGRQAVGGRGLPIGSPGAATTGVYGL